MQITNYDHISEEYYNSVLHPTSNNFKEASKQLISNALKNLNKIESVKVLEVGAGKSVVAEIFIECNYSIANLIITDLHESMLNYSDIYKQYGCNLLNVDAKLIHEKFSNVDCIVSSLGDPYNSIDFWKSVQKTLKKNSYCIFTTPSFQWAEQYRKNAQHSDLDFAYFTLSNGTEVKVPSFIYSKDEQISLSESVGLKLIDFTEFYLEDLDKYKSPKLIISAQNYPIVSCYIFKKSAIEISVADLHT